VSLCVPLLIVEWIAGVSTPNCASYHGSYIYESYCIW